MIKVTFSFDTAEQAIEAIELLEGVPAETEGTPPAAAAPVAGRPRGRPRKTAAADAAPTGAPAAAPAAGAPAATAAAASPAAATTTAAVSGAASAAAVPFDTVAKCITDLAEANRPKAIEVLGKFGVKLASELKPAQFGEFVEECRKALAPAPNASLV